MTFSPETFARRLLLLKPDGKSAALLWSEPQSGKFSEAVRQAAKRLGVAVTTVEVSDPDAYPAAPGGEALTDVLASTKTQTNR